MNDTTAPRRTQVAAVSLAVAATLIGSAGNIASAAFFQIQENNASGIGNAYAGGAAIADDASTVWYNPAGMTRLSGTQYVVAGHYIDSSTTFTKSSATLVLTGGTISGASTAEAGEAALVPNLYYTNHLNDRWWFGLGINAPWGLATDYDDGWVGRYHADRSEIKTININPALAYRVSDTFSAGFGVNVQYIEGTLTNNVDFGSICAASATAGGPGASCATPGGVDGKSRIYARDVSQGYNAGMLWQPWERTRVGLHYRSKIAHGLRGESVAEAPNATAASAAQSYLSARDGNAMTYITVPEMISLSLHQQFGKRWAAMADVTRTRWSRVPELRIRFDTGQADSITTLNLRDVNRYSIGLTYMPRDRWAYRVGVAYDQSPTPDDESRSVRLPDNDRKWLTFGVGYRVTSRASLDFGFVHIDMDDFGIDKVATTTNEHALRGNLSGRYEADVNIYSVQGKWEF